MSKRRTRKIEVTAPDELENRDEIPIAKSSSKQDLRLNTTTNEDQDDDDAETVDITVDTYTDLKSAQATLLRYANKVGIEMDELLEGMENDEKGIVMKLSQDVSSSKRSLR